MMKRLLLALTLGVLVLLLEVGTATASSPVGQVAGQAAGSDQDAGAAAGTAQQEPTNGNVSVRVLSPGDDGPVSQSNEATSEATAGNLNGTEQSAGQTQAGGSGVQAVGQSAESEQDALALAFTVQKGASNENAPVRVLSPGDGGSVSQSNEASSDASAGNANLTGQEAEQEQAGSSCCGSAGTQVVGQSAENEQKAGALAGTIQENPSNSNVSVRVLSPGDDGPVSQTNEATSDATAGNVNLTKQSADQSQAGDCKCGGTGTQLVGQSADSDQEAKAAALTAQKGASNSNVSVRVLSPGNAGAVSQSNVASSNATAGNLNWTGQKADQEQAGGSCKCGNAGTQIVGQSAENEQKAGALAGTIQENPSNSNVSVRVLSPGDDGRVSQTNEATSNASAGNLNLTKQSADQSQAGGSGLQVIGQSAESSQFAGSAALTAQLGARNENAPVRVLSPGDGGSVSQANTASSDAVATNANWTDQDASQTQAGSGFCCGAGIQAIGQLSQSRQGAAALALTLQLGATPPCRCGHKPGFGNSNTPTRVLSPGSEGSVRQANDASSSARATNWSWTKQDAEQLQADPSRCGCVGKTGGIQAIGQKSSGAQFGAALAATLQLGDTNRWAPERKDSPGQGSDLSQIGRESSDGAYGHGRATEQSKLQGIR
jgi:hypothetical protein